MGGRRSRSCPSCLGPHRRGTGARALYRCGRTTAIGVVCPRCVARAILVVMGTAPGVLVRSTVRKPKKSRGAFVAGALGIEPKGGA